MGGGSSHAAPMVTTASKHTLPKYTIPTHLTSIPGNLTNSELNVYLQEISAFLRKGPRLADLQDTRTISRSSIGKKISLTRLRRLLHLSELMLREAFTTFVLMDGKNFFEFLNIFDQVYSSYYQQMSKPSSSTTSTSTNTLRAILFTVALTLILAFL